MAARGRHSAMPAPCARAWKTPRSRTFSKAACMNSSTNSSKTITASAPRSASNICSDNDGGERTDRPFLVYLMRPPSSVRRCLVMRLRVLHRNTYHYDPPAAGVIQVLRLTPRNHEGQYVVRWRIDVSTDARLAAHEDAFGNLTHVFSADGPLSELCVEVDGEVETQNTNGIVRGTVERFAPSLFLRDTD